MRNWKEMKSDEIFAIWSAYVKTECSYESIHFNNSTEKTMRLTPHEIHKLVEELMNRLEIKENLNG